MEDPVHTDRKKGLDTFQGQPTGSTGWLNIDREWFKNNLYLKRTSIKNFLKLY